MKNLFQVPAVVQAVQTLVDGGSKLSVVTRELPPDEMTKVFTLKGKEGWMVFSESEVEEIDIPEEPVVEFKGDKTPAQRLRGVLYRYWESKTSQSTPFEMYYKTCMEKYIDSIKEKL